MFSPPWQPEFYCEKTHEETPDVCKPRNPASIMKPCTDQTVYELYNSPKPYNYQGWNPYDLHKETEEDDGMYAGVREQQEIGAEHA
jgi:hypothetical protein